MTVTLSSENLILSLNGNRPQDIVELLISEMDFNDQEALRNGLYIGRPIKKMSGDAQRGDFIITGVYGYDQSSGAIVVGDKFETGEIVHFHLCDPASSRQDLEMSLVPQVLRDPPQAILQFTCNARGKEFYGHTNAELNLIMNNLEDPHVTGFFSTGEIISIHGRNHLLSNTTCLLLLRSVVTSPE
jgi:small ligand-binding sensory domain FIST